MKNIKHTLLLFLLFLMLISSCTSGENNMPNNDVEVDLEKVMLKHTDYVCAK